MDSSQTLTAPLRTRFLLAIAIMVIAAAVWGVSQTQRTTAEHAFDASQAGQKMLTGMLDQETGLRGFALTRRQEFLGPFTRGERAFEEALSTAEATAGKEAERKSIASQALVAHRWRDLAEDEINLLRAKPGKPLNVENFVVRKSVFDRFRVLNAEFQKQLSTERERGLKHAGLISVGVILLVSALFGGIGYVAIERSSRRERRRRRFERDYREGQSEFAETMQIMRDEGEAHGLVKRHLERVIEGSEVIVLNRNNSDNRLTAATPVPDDSPLSARLVEAGPESCLAVRLGREFHRGSDDVPLLACDLCGMSAPEINCVPSLVSGEVIGSVLVRNARPLRDAERQRIHDSVNQAAPVLANLRNLAIAETQAATAALTDLPNTRACHDTLKRMVAHAGRAVSPLSAIVFDLDRFKEINDRYGHDAGDNVLAAVGEVLETTLRASDFAGRYGGEEFLVLLPDTGSEAATSVAEKLRAAVERTKVAQVQSEITASFGVAAYPADAMDADTLFRMADRALYVAKGGGRNRVEVAEASNAAADRV
jgi:diguanylate cyclase (GGDEF)-like protein